MLKCQFFSKKLELFTNSECLYSKLDISKMKNNDHEARYKGFSWARISKSLQFFSEKITVLAEQFVRPAETSPPTSPVGQLQPQKLGGNGSLTEPNRFPEVGFVKFHQLSSTLS